MIRNSRESLSNQEDFNVFIKSKVVLDSKAAYLKTGDSYIKDVEPNLSNYITDIKNSDPTGMLEKYINLILIKAGAESSKDYLKIIGSKIENTISSGLGNNIAMLGYVESICLGDDFDAYSKEIDRINNRDFSFGDNKKNIKTSKIVSSNNYLEKAKKLVL